MSSGGKRVLVYGPNQTLGASLRILLAQYDVQAANSFPNDLSNADVFVWQLNGEVDRELVAAASHQVPTLVLAAKDELLAAVDAGCRGFLPESASLNEIGDAIDTLLAGGAIVPPDLLGALLRHIVERNRRDQADAGVLEALTEREREVFRVAASGASRDDIADRLFISPETVRTHLQRVYRKLGVHSQVELISLAIRLGETRRLEET